MAARGIFGLISLILVAGGLLFQFFIIFAGAVDGNPVNRWYFLQADTSRIPGAPSISRWTYWNVCGESGGRDVCSGTGYGKVTPAFPFNPEQNFGQTTGVPTAFLNTSYYYYMTRFMFAFMLIALFFGAVSLLIGLLSPCFRIAALSSSATVTFAWVFQGLNAALMTAAYIKGRDRFRSNGQDAQIGTYAFGFEWAAFVCYFLAMITYCVGGSASKESYGQKKRGFFGGRSKSTRSRGSFINGDKEYA